MPCAEAETCTEVSDRGPPTDRPSSSGVIGVVVVLGRGGGVLERGAVGGRELVVLGFGLETVGGATVAMGVRVGGGVSVVVELVVEDGTMLLETTEGVIAGVGSSCRRAKAPAATTAVPMVAPSHRPA
jgi:hypothetical protein